MTRSSKAELERRVDTVYELILSRVSYRAIVGYCAAKWGVSERQARTYMARARIRIAALAAESRAEQLAKAVADYDMLFTKLLAGGRYGEARKTLDSIVHLLGLAAPAKVELYDFSTYSDQQLAQEVARELPELMREAERLTRGAGSPDGSEKTGGDELDPPSPDR